MNNSRVKRQLLEQREKAILENFASKFNMIKRINEDEIFTKEYPEGEQHYNIYGAGKREYLMAELTEYFGKQSRLSNSADWAMPVWQIKVGNEFYEGLFIVLDDNDDLVLIDRHLEPGQDEYIDNVIMKADGGSMGEVEELIEYVYVKVLNKKAPIKRTDPNRSMGPTSNNQ